MKNPWLIPAITLLSGAVGGFIFAKATHSAPASEAALAKDSPRSRPSRTSTIGSDHSPKNPNRPAQGSAGNSGRVSEIQKKINYYANMSSQQLAREAKKLEAKIPGAPRLSIYLLYNRWGEIDPKAALEYSNSQTERRGLGGKFAQSAILKSWTAVDPQSAARYYKENSREFSGLRGIPEFEREVGAGSIASVWAENDPQAALAWARSLTTDKLGALNAAISTIAANDPQAASKMLLSLAPEEREVAIKSIAGTWAAQNFSETETWANSLPPNERQVAIGSAIGSIAEEDPLLASQKIEDLPEGEARQQAIARVVSAWATDDPAAAAQYALSHQNEGAQANSVQDIVRSWTGQDTTKALSFVNSLPVGIVKDSALSSYILSDTKSPHSSLVTLAESITDERSRAQTIMISTGRWMREDPAAATAYVEQSPTIPPRMKERLLNGTQGRRGGPGPR